MELIEFVQSHWSQIAELAWEHVQLVGMYVGVAILTGVPFGIYISQRESLAKLVLAVAGMIMTIPSIALFLILLPVSGRGTTTAIIALTLYTLQIIYRNIVTGLANVPGSSRDAGRGMGMTARQLLWRVELPLAMPVKSAFRYSSGFGPRWGRAHQGIDMAGPVGTPIYSTGDGVVTFAGWQRGYGNLIKVQHALGTETRYGHLSKIGVKVGQKVSRNSLIGAMGNTGRSTGPHLHYEVRVKGRAVDPMSFIKAAQNVF